MTRQVSWVAVLVLISALASAANHVYPNPEAVEPLKPGSSVPSVSVQSLDGELVDLSTLLRAQGALLVFYRGGW